jgi:hypothetical protein
VRLWGWSRQGCEIVYLSSQRSASGVAADRAVLVEHGFPPGELVARAEGETYADVTLRLAPDVLVEDDCESIGTDEMTYPQLPEAARAAVAGVVVPEFGGLGMLPEQATDLLTRG